MPLVGDKKRQYQRDWMARRRGEWFAGKSCDHCGSQENLELNHLDRATKITHRVWSWSRERRESELAKCQPLCKSCHKKVTQEQLTKPIAHGTKSGYNKGCKDECCMEGMRQWFRDYRNRS